MLNWLLKDSLLPLIIMLEYFKLTNLVRYSIGMYMRIVEIGKQGNCERKGKMTQPN